MICLKEVLGLDTERIRVSLKEVLRLRPVFPAGTTRHAPKTLTGGEQKNKFILRRAFLWFSAIALILVAGTNPIVWMLPGSSHFKGKIIEALVEEALTTRLTSGAKSDTDKALALFQFVDTHIFHYQRPARSILNTSFLPFLIPGEAWCDEQALALMDLAGKAHIKASVVYLRGFDKISHHSVCELYLDGAFRIFDPDYGYLFYHGEKIATFYDIQQKDGIRAEKLEAQKALNKGFDGHEYFRLVEPTFDYIVSNSNDKIHLGRMIRAGMVNLYYALFGERFLAYLEDVYFQLSDTHPLLRARIEHLSGRFDAALREYDVAVRQADDTFLKSEALFFRGELLWDMKNFHQSAQALAKLISLYPEHRNREEALFYLGSSYENLNQYERAVFYYWKIPASHNTPAPTRLMRLLHEHPALAKLHNSIRG
jgi:tetratricopeptide (TPR) repeat protein